MDDIFDFLDGIDLTKTDLSLLNSSDQSDVSHDISCYYSASSVSSHNPSSPDDVTSSPGQTFDVTPLETLNVSDVVTHLTLDGSVVAETYGLQNSEHVNLYDITPSVELTEDIISELVKIPSDVITTSPVQNAGVAKPNDVIKLDTSTEDTNVSDVTTSSPASSNSSCDTEQSLLSEKSLEETLHRLDSLASKTTPQDNQKPNMSYVALIAEAILNSREQKLLLCDIYDAITEKYPFYRTEGKSWRNSVRHNLSLNECFVKNGRSDVGKGNYWAIHEDCLESFRKGDFRRPRKYARKKNRATPYQIPFAGMLNQMVLNSYAALCNLQTYSQPPSNGYTPSHDGNVIYAPTVTSSLDGHVTNQQAVYPPPSPSPALSPVALSPPITPSLTPSPPIVNHQQAMTSPSGHTTPPISNVCNMTSSNGFHSTPISAHRSVQPHQTMTPPPHFVSGPIVQQQYVQAPTQPQYVNDQTITLQNYINNQPIRSQYHMVPSNQIPQMNNGVMTSQQMNDYGQYNGNSGYQCRMPTYSVPNQTYNVPEYAYYQY